MSTVCFPTIRRRGSTTLSACGSGCGNADLTLQGTIASFSRSSLFSQEVKGKRTNSWTSFIFKSGTTDTTTPTCSAAGSPCGTSANSSCSNFTSTGINAEPRKTFVSISPNTVACTMNNPPFLNIGRRDPSPRWMKRSAPNIT